MSEDKHTPLPWLVYLNRRGQVCDRESELIADCEFSESSEMDDANAVLIVRSVNALPALVKALEDIANLIDAEDALEPLDDAIGIANKALAAYRSRK